MKVTWKRLVRMSVVLVDKNHHFLWFTRSSIEPVEKLRPRFKWTMKNGYMNYFSIQTICVILQRLVEVKIDHPNVEKILNLIDTFCLLMIAFCGFICAVLRRSKMFRISSGVFVVAHVICRLVRIVDGKTNFPFGWNHW